MGGYWAASPEDEKPEAPPAEEKKEPTKFELVRQRQDRIIELIREGCNRLIPIAERLEVRESNAYYYLKRMEKQGRICNKDGYWEVCEESSSV